MRKLVKYLKPMSGAILICIMLVFTQAMCDLKLPDYMSDIVNVGVQRYGIDSPVPQVLSGKTLEALKHLTREQDTALFEQYYSKLTPDSENYEEIVKNYKNAAKQEAFVLSGVPTPEFESICGKAMMSLAALSSPDFKSKFGDMDPMQAITMMPEEQKNAMLDEIDAKIATVGESTIIQGAAMGIKTEYEALGRDINLMQRQAIYLTGGKMLLVALFSFICTVASAFLAARIAAGVAKNLRADVFKKTVGFSNSEFTTFSTASLITRTTNDVQQLQMLVFMMLRMLVQAPITGIGGIWYAMQKSNSMSWIIALAVILLLCVMGCIFALVMPRFKKVQKLIDKLNLVTRENLSGIMVSKAYNMQDFEEKRFDKANSELTKNNLFVNRASTMMMPMMMLIMNGISLLIVWVGANQIAASAMQVGDMIAFIQYSMQVVMSFLMVSMMFILIPRAAVSGDRIWEVLKTENSVLDPKNPVSINSNPDKIGEVEFQNVSYRFPGAEEDTLKNVSFVAKPGQTTAIIGATGCGKSTLINMVPRFFDATEGKVLVNGVDIRDCTQEDLRKNIGYVPQKAVLFTGTIEENLKLGDKDASHEQVEKAAMIAQATEFIGEKEGGYNEHMAQGGTNVSGGQRQRLSIARALTLDAPIYIFDDSFSALDFKTDAALRRAMGEFTSNSTVLIVAQRVGTIKNAEQIVVLEDGEVVGCGTHGQLMQSCTVYQDIARSQLREEEL